MFNGGGDEGRKATDAKPAASESKKFMTEQYQTWVHVQAVNGVAIAKHKDEIIGTRKADWPGATEGQAVDALIKTLLDEHDNITILCGQDPVPYYEKIDGKLVWDAFNGHY